MTQLAHEAVGDTAFEHGLRERTESEQATQARWVALGSFAVKNSDLLAGGPNMYVLDMFPFPSGSGLHMGHVKGYTATDALAHWYRRQGQQVIHPMGWDSFGLPAETAALNEGIQPDAYVDGNIQVFKEQLEKLGLIYDWDREIKTSDPDYFKWTQKTFLDMLGKGLAYYSNEPINWCEHCETGLANEDLDGTVHDRCGTEVTRRMSPQWAIDMRSGAERLLSNLEALPDWERAIVEAQINWIGKKEGYAVSGKLIEGNGVTDIELFVPTKEGIQEKAISGASHYVAISPQMALDLTKLGASYSEDVGDYINQKLLTSSRERKTTSISTGQHIVIDGVELDLFVSEAVTDKTFGAFILEKDAPLVDADAKSFVLQDLIDRSLAKTSATYEINDWVFSRQRYWGEPIPVVRDNEGTIYPLSEEQLPLKLPVVEKIPHGLDGKSPLDQIRDWVEVRGYIDSDGKFHEDQDSDTVFFRETDTMPNWAGSSAYYKRYLDPQNDDAQISPEVDAKLPQVDIYVGGMEHAARHLIYARFWNQFLHDNGDVIAEEPFRRVQHVGLVLGSDGSKMSKSKGNGINPSDMVAKHGADATRIGMFEMGDFSKSTEWSEEKIESASKFLSKLVRAGKRTHQDLDLTDEQKQKINTTIDTVNNSLESFKFGAAISSIKSLFNSLSRLESIPQQGYDAVVSLLQPFAPHVAELVFAAGAVTKEDLAAYRPWPQKYDVEVSQSAHPTPVALLVGGKFIGEFDFADMDKSGIEGAVRAMGYTVVKNLMDRPKPTIIVKPNN